MRTQCSGGQWAHKKSDKHHISSALIEVFSRPHGVIIEEENLKRNVLFDTICLTVLLNSDPEKKKLLHPKSIPTSQCYYCTGSFSKDFFSQGAVK